MNLRLTAVALATATLFAAPAVLAQGAPGCAIPDTRPTVVVGTVDSGVTNIDVDGAGPGTCRVNDLINETAPWGTKAAFVSHVTSVVNSVPSLSDSERTAIIAAANAFDFGRIRPVKLVAFNDLHGNLQPPGGTFFGIPGGSHGGVDFLAGYINVLRGMNPAHSVISSGDLIGASPLVSALFLDEPTIEAMNALRLNMNVLGNHEFDRGRAELLRMQSGGCATDPALLVNNQTCASPSGSFPGARWPFFGSNVRKEDGSLLFPPYLIQVLNGVRVGFVGAVTETTPTIVTPSGVAGLTFSDEADSINALVGQVRNRGVETIVAVVHEGGSPAPGQPIGGCGTLTGSIVDIVARLDDAVDIVLTGHSHQSYICMLANRSGRMIPVVQGGAFGRAVTDVDLWIDTRTRNPVRIDVRNVPIDRRNAAVTADPAVASLIAHYDTASAPLRNRVIGRIGSTLSNTNNAACQRQAGDLIADAQLTATQAVAFGGAQIALMNPGGVRAPFTFNQSSGGEPDGDVTYGEAFTVQPFGNSLVTMTLTGQQIHDLLAQQFVGCPNGQPFNRVLQVSSGFTYQWDNARGTDPTSLATCSRIVPGSVRLNGAPIDLATNYRVTVNSFMADGGDNFSVLRDGGARLGGALDIDALIAFLQPTLTGTPYAAPPLNRIVRVDAGATCPSNR
jgi:5'-nucleotidase